MYKWDAAHYHRNSSPQEEWAQGALSKLHLSGDERILDIGCGDGKLTAALARRVPRGSVVGIDSSREMIEFAGKKFPSSENRNLSFVRGDATALPYREEFDVAVSFSCLHWVSDHRAVQKGIARSLKPGGRSLLHFGGKGNARATLDLLPDMFATSPWKQYFEGFTCPWTFLTVEEYCAIIEGAGMIPKRIELIPKENRLTREGFKGWLSSTWIPFLERLPESLRERFLEEIIERFLKAHPQDTDGKVIIPMMRLEVQAEKPS
jgi:trans-aconitate methyltransferase